MIIRILTWCAVLFTLVAMYLRMNKIWKRKHEPEVASSLSIVALAMSAGLNSIWAANFIIHWDAGAVVDNLILVIESSFLIVIAAGTFLAEKKGLSFWVKVKRALSLERKEAGYLLSAMAGRDHGEMIVGLLHQLAMIDGAAAETELKLINEFASHWGVRYDAAELDKSRAATKAENFARLRTGVDAYLKRQPTIQQVAQVCDVMQRLVNADEELTDEEALILEELQNMMKHYMDADSALPTYHVLVIPQNDAHLSVLSSLKPDIKKIPYKGGYGYVVNTYNSQRYAEMISHDYRSKELLTVVYCEDEKGELTAAT